MRSFSLIASVALAICGLAGLSTAASAAIDEIDVTTSYQFGAPGGNVGYSGSPDTGFATFTNAGNTTFTGTISDVAVSGCCGDYSQSFNVTLAPGQSLVFGVAPESSNVGGFNGSSIVLNINGTFTDAYVAAWSVSDSQIHSGVVNGGGVTDAYVLQGGCPSGCDYGDAIEVTQAPGSYIFRHVSAIPEPSTWAMMLLGFLGLGAVTYRRSRTLAAA